MGKTVIREEAFPEIINQYNSGGKKAAYSMIRERYGIQHPGNVVRRIKECGKYTYDAETDCFHENGESVSDSVFMGLEELCGTSLAKVPSTSIEAPVSKPAAMEKLIHELISDRLLAMSRYITLDLSTRTVLIDRTTLSADGYRIITH